MRLAWHDVVVWHYRHCMKLRYMLHLANLDGSSAFRKRLTVLAATSEQRQRKLLPADCSIIPMVQDLRRPGESEVLARHPISNGLLPRM